MSDDRFCLICGVSLDLHPWPDEDDIEERGCEVAEAKAPLTPDEIEQVRRLLVGDMAVVPVSKMIADPKAARDLLEMEGDLKMRNDKLPEAYPNRLSSMADTPWDGEGADL